ncbi:L-dopachrome tautomerase-related protein [Acaryochloris sp. CCMEE 5410]|uniref:L-dopachrome tautomerase-related protein n=1 Tax=Acaryochloris sp. CCMEE 5410 TaxID=310037 RepID=UPI0002483F43|nr:L-dopachrome tautomerase-related protein [Acaryochloris sp. CCMEE 5410]KAI9130959.1 hypothetical protein ON05_024995 [Acaryochloris sp. CCMEE 5410]
MNWPNLRFCRRQVVIAVCTCLVLIGFHFHPPQAVTAKPTTNQLEIVAELPQGAEVGNIAVTADKRIFCSVHSFFGNQNRAIEVLDQKNWQIYPNSDWGKAPDASPPNWSGLNNTLGIQADGTGNIWFLDNPNPAFPTGRLIAWDTRRDELHQVIYLPPPVITENAFLNDFAVDAKHEAIYIADTAGGPDAALIVVDLKTGLARRVLQGSPNTVPEDIDIKIDGRVISLGDAPARIGVNPITIDPAYQWVYFGAMNGQSLYRIRTSDLLNQSLNEQQLKQKVQRYGDKPISDGITADSAGNIYITDITANAIGVINAAGKYQILYQDDQTLSWPDGLAIGPDGYVYGTVNQLHKSPPLNGGNNDAIAPFLVIRFPTLAPSSVGR